MLSPRLYRCGCEGKTMNWNKLLTALDDFEFGELNKAMQFELQCRGLTDKGIPTLTEEERKMESIERICSVRLRLGLSLPMAKSFCEQQMKATSV